MVIDPVLEGHVGCIILVVVNIEGGGINAEESYIMKALPSPPSPPEVI